MFVYTLKATTLKYIGVMMFSALAIILTVVLVPASPKDYGEVEAVAEHTAKDFRNIKTEEDRVEFLESYGWEIARETQTVTEITIPTEFDSVFSEYNLLQKSEGLDLEKYKGKKATLYTYEVLNSSEPAVASLIVYKNRIIGGDVSSTSQDGFQQGFTK